MGYSEPTHQVSTFSGRADDLHTGGILQVVYMGDSKVALSAIVFTTVDEYRYSSSDEWSIRANYSDFRGHAVSMRLGSQG